MDDPDADSLAEDSSALPWSSIDPDESDAEPIPHKRISPAALSALPAEFSSEASSEDGEDDAGENPLSVSIASGMEPTSAPRYGGGWTLPLVCAAVALIACCLIIPQADANRRLAYQKRMLEMDLQSIQKQVAVNDEFLKKVGEDPTLAERLAQRQMKVVRAGSRVLQIGQIQTAPMSPFQLLNVPRPAPLPLYRPVGGTLASLCCQPRSRLYLLGVALFMLAAGLVLGLEDRGPEL